jgi:hypothetical protein
MLMCQISNPSLNLAAVDQFEEFLPRLHILGEFGQLGRLVARLCRHLELDALRQRNWFVRTEVFSVEMGSELGHIRDTLETSLAKIGWLDYITPEHGGKWAGIISEMFRGFLRSLGR